MGGDKAVKNWFERHPKIILISLVLVALVVITFAAEMILAFRNRPYPSYINRYAAKRHIRLREHQPNIGLYVSPKPWGIRDPLQKDRYLLRIDKDGFIMPSQVHAKPDAVVVFLGGSTTECCFVDEENRFPYVAGRLLEQDTGLKVNALNASRSGNNSLNSINNLWNNAMRFKPDVAVMMHNINDLAILMYEKSYWNTNKYRSPIEEVKPSIIRNLEDSVHLFRDLTIPNLYQAIKGLSRSAKPHPDEFARFRGKKTVIDPPFLEREYRKNLLTFINICRAQGVEPVLMTMASRFKEKPDPILDKQVVQRWEMQQVRYEDFKAIFDRFNQINRELGAENGVKVIDLAAKVPQEKEYIYDAVHFNDQGSRLAGRIISAEIKPILMSRKKPPDKSLAPKAGSPGAVPGS